MVTLTPLSEFTIALFYLPKAREKGFPYQNCVQNNLQNDLHHYYILNIVLIVSEFFTNADAQILHWCTQTYTHCMESHMGHSEIYSLSLSHLSHSTMESSSDGTAH